MLLCVRTELRGVPSAPQLPEAAAPQGQRSHLCQRNCPERPGRGSRHRAGSLRGSSDRQRRSSTRCPYGRIDNPISPRCFCWRTALAPRRSPRPGLGDALPSAPEPTAPAAAVSSSKQVSWIQRRWPVLQSGSVNSRQVNSWKPLEGDVQAQENYPRVVLQPKAEKVLQPAQGTAAPADPKTRGVILSGPSQDTKTQAGLGFLTPTDPKRDALRYAAQKCRPAEATGPVTQK